MISPKLYKNSGVYDFFIKALGYENAIDRFLHSIDPDCPTDGRILDVGCGTGLLGLHFLKRFPDAQLVATDLEPNFLNATLENADARGLDRKRIKVGVANISTPARLTNSDNETLTLEDESFALVCIGAVVGYADDPEDSLRQLIRLVQPGGYLVNIEMNESLTGRLVSNRYHYHNIPLARMLEIIRNEGCEVSATSLSLSHLPARLTRTALIAQKPAG